MKFPIIDSHHHIWKQSDIEWLQGEIQPRIFGDYTSIKKDYLIDDYIEDVFLLRMILNDSFECFRRDEGSVALSCRGEQAVSGALPWLLPHQ